jgi:hypothetical protein
MVPKISRLNLFPSKFFQFVIHAASYHLMLHTLILDSAVALASSYGLGGLGFESWQQQEIFRSTKPSRLALGPIQPFTRLGSFLGVKQVRREVHHSTPSSAEVTNGWTYTFAHPISLHGMDRATSLSSSSFFFL